MEYIVSTEPPEDFSPGMWTVGSYCFVGDTFLLLKRRDEKVQGGRWSLPGGKIDQGENPRDAIIREILEETGIVVKPEDLRFLKKFYVRYPMIDYVHHEFKVVLSTRPKKIVLHAPEHQDATWVTPEEALGMELIYGKKDCIKLHGDALLKE